MSDQTPEAQQQAAGAQQRGSIRLNYANTPVHYANLALVNTTPEEVVLNFAVNVVPPSPEREVSVDINNRVILSYPSAKRLALTLGNIISRYEEANGVISVPRPQTPTGAEDAE